MSQRTLTRCQRPMGFFKFCLASLLSLCLLSLAPSTANAQDDITSIELVTSPLYIETANGRIDYQTEIADTPETSARGLMFRESLGERAGMLFIFSPPREPAMWMKNTLISLDMLFLDADGKIIAIARNTVPGSLRHLSPGMPVSGVLEINGGQAAALGIAPGDTVHHDTYNNFDPPLAE